MTRLFGWVATNLDAFFALVLAVGTAALGLTNVISQEVVNNATLLVLAVLAETILRDRWRRNTTEGELRTVLDTASRTLGQLPARLDRLASVDEALTRTRMTLDNISMVRVLHGSEVAEALAEARRAT